MSDRKMLEFAAKAAGMNVSWDHYDPDYCAGAEGMFLNGERSPDNSKYWNPIADDGDALRLAVKCGISVLQFPACIGTGWPQNGLPASLIGFDPPYEDISSGQDVLAATRRAIVRAAAEIGRRMP